MSSAQVTRTITLPSLGTTALENTNDQIKRLALLNDNYRKRYITYTKMAAFFVFLLVAIVVVKALEGRLPYYITNLLMIIAVLIFLYYENMYYGELGSRSKLNYDELEVSNDQSAIDNKNKGKGGVLDGANLGYCLGSDCCPDGMKYSTTLNKCVPDCSVATLNIQGNGPEKCWTETGCKSSITPGTVCLDTFTTIGEAVDFQNSREKLVHPSDISHMIAPKDLGYKPFNPQTDNVSIF